MISESLKTNTTLTILWLGGGENYKVIYSNEIK